ncbi:MAG: hypothetical protein HFI50_03860 [Lachnospiraceae bacterium]|nr:hypothetical protein [Lachnospiraceae bacterium]
MDLEVRKLIPVFVHHEGNASYVKDCIVQAQKYNERVILFGDKTNREMGSEWYDVSDFTSLLWEEFQQYYEHMSYYPTSYAIQIIKRFFIFYDFMVKNGIDECVIIDSDVLVFINFSEIPEIRNYKAAFTIPKDQGNMRIAAGAGVSYWKRETLYSFLLFSIDLYKNQRNRLEEKWQYHIDNHQDGGVCEMNYLYWWYMDNADDVWNWCQYSKEGVVDSNFNLSENFFKDEYYMDKHNVGKVIIAKNHRPYFSSVKHGLVPAWAIHFGGGSKVYMHYFRTHLKIAFWVPYVRRVKSKIKHLFV